MTPVQSHDWQLTGWPAQGAEKIDAIWWHHGDTEIKYICGSDTRTGTMTYTLCFVQFVKAKNKEDVQKIFPAKSWQATMCQASAECCRAYALGVGIDGSEIRRVAESRYEFAQ